MASFRRTEIGGVSFSRLIVGTNWFLGYSHMSKAKDSFIKSYQTRKNIADILTVFMDAGVDTIMGMPEPILRGAISDAQDRTGRTAKLMLTPHFNITAGGSPESDLEPVFDRCKELGATFCFPHQCVTDRLIDRMEGKIRHIDKYTAMIRERGMVPGLSTHMPYWPYSFSSH